MPVFIVGTDTDVGKTFVSSWLTHHLPLTYWKPIQSGTDINVPDDFAFVAKMAKIAPIKPVYSFAAPLSPHLASALENVEIQTEKLKIPEVKNLIIEGAGGIFVPLTNTLTLLDWMSMHKLPTLIVARDHLGTINHTCLTIEALRNRNIPVLGVVLNQTPGCSAQAAHQEAIEHFGKVPILATLPILQSVSQISPPQRLQESLAHALESH